MIPCDVRSAVDAFYQARAVMADGFSVQSASAVVSAVLDGSKPRKGKCVNGWDYFVHGVGYTVVLPSEAQLHIDAGKSTDVISLYDIRFYLESLGCDVPELADLRGQCEALVREGVLGALDGTKYELLALNS
jgi:hypothetical protein